MPVIVKLPPNLFKVDPKENVTRFGAVITKAALETTVINAGNDRLVSKAKFTLCVDALLDSVANDEKSAEVAAGPRTVKAFPTVANAGKL